jgi:hypothetical protein
MDECISHYGISVLLKKESVFIVDLDVERTPLQIIKRNYLVALYVGIHSLKRFSNSADYTSPIDIEHYRSNSFHRFEQKPASDLILLVYFSSSHKFRILDYFISCLSRYFSMNYKSQKGS